MEQKKSVRSNDMYLRAEKQVFAGIYGRLFARYISQHEEEHASYLALAVTRELLGISSDEDKTQAFIEKYRDQISDEIAELKNDTALRRIVTDAVVIKVVFLHKQGGCNTDEAYESIEKIKEMGIYLEGDRAPTPGSFVQAASRFFTETPLRQPGTSLSA
jgi:hypothetical protein